MTDEKFMFVSDVADKKRTARGSHNKRTHCGKGGRVRLPSDNMTRKELNKMNGEVKLYRMNEPMTWKEFMTMDDDLKCGYIKLIRQKYNAPGKYIAEMMGTNVCYYSKEINRLGISEGKNARGRYTSWGKEGFYAWCNRNTPTPNETEEPEEVVVEQTEKCEGEHFSTQTILTLSDREVVCRALGLIEGLSYGVMNIQIRDAIVSAVGTITTVLDGGMEA